MPSPPLNLNEPFGEFDFKPIVNPSPEFFKFKPVESNPFLNDDIVLAAPRLVNNDVIDGNIDTISAPYVEPDLKVLGQTIDYDDALDTGMDNLSIIWIFSLSC